MFEEENKYSFYTEKDELKESPLCEFELGQHSVDESFPVIHGWTPRFRLEEAGFKKEYEIDLIQIRQKIVKGNGGIAYFQARGVSAGTRELFEKHRKELENAFTQLNQKRIDYFVFRSYRKFPPWDNILCYSVGDFVK